MSDTDTKPIFEPFTWFHNPTCHHNEIFVSDARDIGDGLAVMLQLLEHDFLMAETEDQQMLDNRMKGALMRLAVVNAQLLARHAESEIACINRKARDKPGKAL